MEYSVCPTPCEKFNKCGNIDDQIIETDSSLVNINIVHDERQGRHLVANTDIDSGTILLTESVLVSSPSSCLGSSIFRAVCLGCYRFVTKSYKCSKCHWPLCSEECENSIQHEGNECPIFTAHRVQPITKNYQYEFIKTLRCLLLKENDPGKWAKLLQLESHVSARRKIPVRIQLSYETIEFIRSTCKLTTIDPITIDYVVGVNGVNGFGLQLPQNPGYYLFYLTSLMSHDCEPNTTTKFNNGQVSIVSLRPIKKGEVITTTYVDLRLGFVQRQAHLLKGYYFTCICKRCTRENLEEEA